MNSRSLPTIAVVDDNPVIRELLRGLIRHDARVNYIGEATNGEAAIELVRTMRPDVLCLDVVMPKLDGLAVLQAIQEASANTRVVVITGHATSDIVAQALKRGAADFLVKPFQGAQLS